MTVSQTNLFKINYINGNNITKKEKEMTMSSFKQTNIKLSLNLNRLLS